MVIQFTVVPFRLSIAPKDFTKLQKAVASSFVEQVLNALFYLHDWLLTLLSRLEAELAVQPARDMAESMSFTFSIPK